MTSPGSAPSRVRSGRPRSELRVARLDQVRVLANPLRLRMLEAFGQEPRTTKQVAQLLGEKPTRLYHHVDALSRAGLIELHHTRQNRGAIEKYFTAVARRFEVGHDLFASHGAAAESESVAMIRTLVEATHREVLGYFGSEHDKPSVPPLVARASIRATAADVKRLRDDLQTLLSKATSKAAGTEASKGEDPRLHYVLSLFFHPASEDAE